MTNTETAGAGTPSDRPMQHDEALRRAGMVAIRMGREGDSQTAETVRAQIARIQALEADNQTLRTGYAAARLEIESLRARSVEPAGEYPVLPSHGHASDGASGAVGYSADQMRAYGEACWKAGYKHGAWAAAQPAGAQQPGAAYAVTALAQLRHLYTNLKNGGVRDTAQAKRIADGLLGPVIESLERAQVAPAAVVGPVEFTAEHVTYIRRYGGSCRDCADENGVCPNRGLPCADSEKAIRFVLDALAYGINHGYIASPTTHPAPQQEAREPLTDSQIMASIGRNAGKPNTSISESRPLGQQWDQVCNLVRDIFRERYAPAPQQEAQEPVAWRELCRRLYVELFHCDQQMTSGERPKWQQGKTVRDVLADAKAALDAAPQPSPASQGDVLDAARLDWLESQSQVNIERVRYLGADTSIYEVTPFNSTDYNGETLRKAIDAARAAQEGK